MSRLNAAGKLNVILPGLIWPEPADLEYILTDKEFPAIDALLAKGRVKKHSFNYSDIIYHKKFIEKNLTLAENFAKEIDLNSNLNSAKSFMIAEPTHLKVDRDRLLIAESELLQIGVDEAEAILAVLNTHFFDDGIKFHYFKENLWLVEFPESMDKLATYPIVDIVGNNIDDYLPVGLDGKRKLRLHSLINEIQMLLFTLPLNAVRQKEGSLFINSLWLWDKKYKNLPFSMENLLSTNSEIGQHLDLSNLNLLVQQSSTILIDQAYYPACYRDSYSWLESVNQIDSKIINELLKMLKLGKFKVIDFWLTAPEGCIQVELKRSGLLKFWHRGTYKSIINELLVGMNN